MSPEQWLQLGGLGAFAFWVAMELRTWRVSQERRDEERKVAEAEDRERTNGWLASIHSRLGDLGADTLPPPVARPPGRVGRERLLTPPPIPPGRKETP